MHISSVFQYHNRHFNRIAQTIPANTTSRRLLMKYPNGICFSKTFLWAKNTGGFQSEQDIDQIQQVFQSDRQSRASYLPDIFLRPSRITEWRSAILDIPPNFTEIGTLVLEMYQSSPERLMIHFFSSVPGKSPESSHIVGVQLPSRGHSHFEIFDVNSPYILRATTPEEFKSKLAQVYMQYSHLRYNQMQLIAYPSSIQRVEEDARFFSVTGYSIPLSHSTRSCKNIG